MAAPRDTDTGKGLPPGTQGGGIYRADITSLSCDMTPLPSLEDHRLPPSRKRPVDAEDWATETKAAFLDPSGRVHPSDSVVRGMQQRRSTQYQDIQGRRVNQALKRLRILARTKYGSVEHLFKAASLNQKAKVTLFDLSRAIRASKLEPYFGRDMQRLVFESAKGARGGIADYRELLALIQPDQATPSGEKRGVAAGGTTESSGASGRQEKPQQDEEELQVMGVDKHVLFRIAQYASHDDDTERTKNLLNDAIHRKCREAKVPDEWAAWQYLLNAFQQCDKDMSGYLTPEDIADVCAKKHLNLGVDPADVLKVANSIQGKRSHGRIKYRNLIGSLELIPPEPTFHPLFDRRSSILRAVRDAYEKPASHESVEAAKRTHEVKQQRAIDAAHAAQLKHDAEQESVELQGRGRVKDVTRPRSALWRLTLKDTLPHDTATEKRAVTSAQELFSDLVGARRTSLSAICPRVMAPPPTNWQHVGYGGDGIDEASGMYLDSKQRFTTTNNSYYSEMISEPSHPPTRHMLSDAERAALKRSRRVATKRMHIQGHLKRIREGYAAERLNHRLKDEARVRHKTGQALGYLQQSFEADFFRQKTGLMQRKPNPAKSAAIWGGSRDQQFNLLSRSPIDERDFKSTYAVDFMHPQLGESEA